MGRPESLELLAKGSELLGLDLSPGDLAVFDIYLGKLLEWNRVINLTSLGREEDIIVKHFLDSLSCLLSGKIENGQEILDIGTGAGFPGIPIKIVKPGIKLTLLDSSKKRIDFLLQLTKALGLEVKLVPLRSEEFARSDGRDLFDVVLARAVSTTPVLLEYALPLLKEGGYLIAQKGPKIAEELDRVREASVLLGGTIEEVKEVKVPFLPERRFLVLARKVAETPAKYPRKAGIPAKRPLGMVK